MSTTQYKDLWYGFLVSLVLLVVGFTPIEDLLQNKTAAIVNPVQFGFYSLGLSVQKEITFLRDVRNLQKNVVLLERENVELKGELSELAELRRENTILKEQLGSIADEGDVYIHAYVIGRGVSGSESLIKINRGQRDGVSDGASVVIGNNLVGVVDERQETFSFVRLVTDSTLKISALDQDSPNRAKGIVSGEFGSSMIMDKIFQDEQISPGDIVITSGENGRFPKGLVLGEVLTVGEQASGVLKSAKITPRVDVTRLEEVFVVMEEER